MIRILALDGGGIKGIIPALFLAEIEKLVKKPICKIFDLIAGTSSGGISTLALTLPDSTKENPYYSAIDLVRLYKEEGKKIFKRNWKHYFLSLDFLIGSKYPCEYFENYFEVYFGNAELKDALTEVLIPAYEVQNYFPHFFKRHKAKVSENCNFYLKDIVRATSAAPIYFPAKTTNALTFVDGGVFANNPSTCAYAEALRLFKNETLLLLSIGTGKLIQKKKVIPKDWGLFQWAFPLSHIVLDSAIDTVDYQMRQILQSNSPLQDYYRWNVKVDENFYSLDDTSNTNLSYLEETTLNFINKNKEIIDEVCSKLEK